MHPKAIRDGSIFSLKLFLIYNGRRKVLKTKVKIGKSTAFRRFDIRNKRLSRVIQDTDEKQVLEGRTGIFNFYFWRNFSADYKWFDVFF